MGPIGCKYFAYKIGQNKMIDIQNNYLYIKKLILNNFIVLFFESNGVCHE